MAQKKGLGRGLAALIPQDDMDLLRRVARGEEAQTAQVVETAGSPAPPSSKDKKSNANVPAGNILNSESINVVGENIKIAPPQLVATASICANPFQPRRQFSEAEMENLAASIREHGILQPVLLRITDVAEQYELVAGERRWRAAQRVGLEFVPALVRELDDRQSLELAIIENVQRHDISAIDTALAYQKLAVEFQLSQEDIAKRVGKSRSAVTNTIRLLDLPDEVRKAIEDGALSEGHGRAILTAPGEGTRRAVFRRVIRDQLSVRDTERLASKTRASDSENNKGKTLESTDAVNSVEHSQAELRDLERLIEKSLGLRVSIRPKGGAGSVVIRYLAPDDLERLRVLLGRPL